MFKSFFRGVEQITPAAKKENIPVEKKTDNQAEKISENYGLPEIDNPEILRLVSAIDLGYLSPEKIDAQMDKITRNLGPRVAEILAERAQDKVNEKKSNTEVFSGPYNKYLVEPEGRVVLLKGLQKEVDSEVAARAQEFGMEIK